MMAIAAITGRAYVGERRAKSAILGVDTIPDRRAVLHWINENSSHCARRNIDDSVDRPTPLRESGKITGQETETLLTPHWRGRNARVQPEQVGDRTRVARSATGTNRRHVLDQRKQVRTRRRRNGDP